MKAENTDLDYMLVIRRSILPQIRFKETKTINNIARKVLVNTPPTSGKMFIA